MGIDEIDKLIRDACNAALKEGAAPEDVSDACLAHGIGLACRITSPAQVATALLDNAQRLMDQARQERGEHVEGTRH